MTILALDSGRAAAKHSLFGRLNPTVQALVAALPLALALCWPKIVVVWQTGSFFDTDDAMRAVQVRDWMAGQGWFDLSAHRMGLPPGSLLMHWSRVVDVPLAILIRLFGLVLSPEMAERATRIVFPVALQAGMIAAIAYPARVVGGARAAMPAALLLVLGGISTFQFVPGRIDHHAPQILLLTLITGTVLDALDPGRARRAALTGCLAALSLAISLENLPFLAVILVVLPLAWIVSGERMAASLLHLAGGLAAALTAAFIATVPAARYGVPTADAFSILQYAAGLSGALALLILACASGRCRSVVARAALAATLAALVGGAVVLLFPGSLHGPYRDVDPLLRTFWLDHVDEAIPITELLRDCLGTALPLAGPLAIGAVAALAACWSATGLGRARWGVVLALSAVGILGSLWEFRVATSLQPLALLGGAWAVARLLEKAEARPILLAPLLVLAVALSSLAWALLPLSGRTVTAATLGSDLSCQDARSFQPLAELPPGLAFAPIDAGSYLLAHTRLAVLAGAYHRNQAGNRAVIEGLLAAPDAARRLLERTGARYLIACPSEMQIEADGAPDGLAAALAAGRVPAWLTPIGLDGPTPFRAYAIE